MAFVIASIMLALAPGPDNLYVINQSMTHGRRVGWAITAGLCTGLIGHTAMVAVGLASWVLGHPPADAIIRWVGAAYLIYLAFRVVRASPGIDSPEDRRDTSGGSAERSTDHSGTRFVSSLDRSMPLAASYRRGLLMNLTNPKVMMFFVAYLPGFIDVRSDSPTVDVMTLGAVFAVCTAWVFGSMAYFAASVSRLLSDTRMIRYFNITTAIVLVCLAIGFVWTS